MTLDHNTININMCSFVNEFECFFFRYIDCYLFFNLTEGATLQNKNVGLGIQILKHRLQFYK